MIGPTKFTYVESSDEEENEPRLQQNQIEEEDDRDGANQSWF